MISFKEAYNIVLDTAQDFGTVTIPLSKANGRILAEDIHADRDFPPFDRATKDGIAIQIKEGHHADAYTIKGVAAAGVPQLQLQGMGTCLEIMTGAILPVNANAVVMYEHMEITDGTAKINTPVRIGQNIHFKGSDAPKGSLVLSKGKQITAAEIGVLAAVGKSEILVRKNPKVTLFSTGDELVPVASNPETHQIRQSNSHTLRAALLDDGIASDIIHVADDKSSTAKALRGALDTSDVLLLSGGVSKGKFDYLPGVLEELGVQKKFHRVQQRPGKPFWFGVHQESSTTIFGFPGNPTSTFANFHVYFKPWLNAGMGKVNPEIQVILGEPFKNTTNLARFIRAYAFVKEGQLIAKMVQGNGSGDLTSLVGANGFIGIGPNQAVGINDKVMFIPTRKVI